MTSTISLQRLLLPYCVLLFCCSDLKMAASGTVAPSAGASRNIFAADLFQKIVKSNTKENVIYSPASIQACLALAYLGAEGETAQQMQTGLKLYGDNKQAIAENYGEFLEGAFNKQQNEDGPLLKMANGMFVNDNLKVSPKFADLAQKYFHSKATPVKFADAPQAVGQINSWVEQETNKKIQNLLQEGSVNADTSAVLVNAIYFKAKWAKQFSDSSTHKADFKTSSTEQQSVDMMFLDDRFKYGELANLDATVLEMPYENTDLTMLVLLPKKVDGLAELEQKLQGVDLNTVTAELQMEDVDVFFPKFKIEFDLDLKEPLSELGMSSMFGDKANFSSLFESETPQKISDVKHKAVLEVNEAGSEAAAATFIKIVPMSLNLEQKRFVADHPFVFAIRNTHAVFFAGHVAKF